MQPITIVTVSDNQYCVLLAALLKSIEVNTTSGRQVTVFVVDDGISEENKRKLQRSIQTTIELIFIEINDVVKDRSKLPLDSSSFPLNVYIRLFIPYFVPQELSRALYLDVDMIVTQDLSELWDLNLQGKMIAAVADRCENIGNPWGGIRNFEELGLNPAAPYFNSGLLVIDLDAWRSTNTTQDVLSCIANNKAYAGFPDQYGLNVILVDNWLQLDQRWNCYAPAEIADPYIIHFIGIKPIFRSYNFNKNYQKEFFRYLSLTEWNGYKVKSDYRRLLKKVKNLLVKKVLTVFKTA